MNALHAALLKVQKSLRPAKRNQSAERDGQEFDYADLKSVVAACRKKLNDEDIVVYQFPRGEMVGAVFMASVQTVLQLAPEKRIVSDVGPISIEATASCPCPPTSHDYAATVTVLRRVGLASLVGLVQEESKIVDGLNAAHRAVESRRRANGAYRCPKCGASGAFAGPCSVCGTEKIDNAPNSI